jgi:hypothetical protein
MKYHLAEVNIAKFKVPVEDPVNAEFVQNLDRVNAIAEAQPGFVWRLKGAGNSATDLKAFDDPNIAINMSVWTDMESLAAFAYRNPEHRKIMARRKEWFERIEFYLALWWIPEGHVPTIDEAKSKLAQLASLGSTKDAFTFGRPFPAPDATPVKPIFDRCA